MTELLRTAIIAAINGGDLIQAEARTSSLADLGERVDAGYLRGIIRLRQGRLDEAESLLAGAALMAPGRLDIVYNQGVALQALGRLEDAVALWRRVWAEAPDHWDAGYNLARGLSELGRLADAAAIYAGLVRSRPDNRDALFNLGNCLHRLGDFAGAVGAFAELLPRHPGFAKGWANCGLALSEVGREADAEQCLRTAISLDPDLAPAHCDLARLLLWQRRWAEGWEAFEWRRRLATAPRFEGCLPPWRGDAGPGARVLLWNDQGRGDAIQFLRHVPALADRGQVVVVRVQDDLVRLAASVPGVTAAVGLSAPLPDCDFEMPLLSLPYRLGLDDPAGSWTGPYVAAAADFHLPRRPGLLQVGLVWAGNPHHDNDAHRSLPLAALAPLLEVEGVAWSSLQVGEAAGQLAQCRAAAALADLSPALTDFAVTAAAVRDLDLVVTVDTAVAHLAGALGKPAWVMLPAVGLDWRWGRSGTATGLYPSLRLFRQNGRDGRRQMIGALAEALRRAVRARCSGGPENPKRGRRRSGG